MKIPQSVGELLWEYRIKGAIEPQWEDAVLERVMQRGGWAEMRWLTRTFDRRRLQDFLSRRGHRVLAPRELRYWSLLAGVPDDEQDAWVAGARRRDRKWRG
jgi:hypothetical protein